MLPVNLGCVIPSTSWNIQLGVRLARKNGAVCSKYIEIYTNGRFRPFSAYVCLDSEKTTHVINILESLSYDNIFRIILCINMGEIKEVDLWDPCKQHILIYIYSIYISFSWWSVQDYKRILYQNRYINFSTIWCFYGWQNEPN